MISVQLAIKADAELDPGQGTYEVHGRKITGSDGHGGLTFAPISATCNLETLAAANAAPLPARASSASASPMTAGGATPTPSNSAASSPANPPSRITTTSGNAILLIRSGLQAQPNGPNPLANHPYVLLRDNLACIMARAGVQVPAGESPYKVLGNTCGNHTPDCQKDYDRQRKIPNNLAIGVFSDPPRPSDLKGLAFDKSEISDLKICKPGDCQVQMPANGMEELHKSVDWSAADVNDQVNQLLQKTVLQGLIAYQRKGNAALGAYNDKPDPTEVPKQFAYMLSYGKALPVYLTDFYRYLLDYPKSQPANAENNFYWAKVKFGLKQTLRVEHVVTMRGNPPDQIAYAIAEKQLYSSHYFQTALDLSFCVRGTDDNKQPGFYLIMVMGSEQAGLTGVKGSIIRKTAVGRSVSNLKDALTTIKNTLEVSR